MTKRPHSPRKQLAENQPPAIREVMEVSAWVPDPMQLAQLAAQLLRNGTTTTTNRALQQAWGLFANSVALCVELRRESPQKLSKLYGNVPGIVHSGTVSQMIEQSGTPPKTLRFYPQSRHTDPVREFFGVKKARTIADNIKEYCLHHQEEDNGCPYDGILIESKGVQDGETYHNLPVEFLQKIKDFKHEKKVAPWRKPHCSRPKKPLRLVVPDNHDEEEQILAVRGLHFPQTEEGVNDPVSRSSVPRQQAAQTHGDAPLAVQVVR